MRQFLFRLWQDEAGQDLTEYALLMVLIGCLDADAGQYDQ
jgi:Flp pilus assembly pilin Flp